MRRKSTTKRMLVALLTTLAKMRMRMSLGFQVLPVRGNLPDALGGRALICPGLKIPERRRSHLLGHLDAQMTQSEVVVST